MTEIRDGRQVIAQVSRAWFRLRDTYGVDVAPEENDALIICIAICLDRIHYDEDRRQPRSPRHRSSVLVVITTKTDERSWLAGSAGPAAAHGCGDVLKTNGCGNVMKRGVFAKSHNHPARSARRLVIEATFTM